MIDNKIPPKYKTENGSVTLFVLVSMLFFLVVSIGTYISVSNKATKQKSEINRIQQGYQDTNIDEIYNRETDSQRIKIKFDGNGGTITFSEKEVAYGEKYGEFPGVERLGYTHNGWYTAKDGGTQIFPEDRMEEKNNITLYAHWTINQYTVAYNSNGGTGTMTTDTITYGTDYTTKANTFTRTGYTFLGWNEKADGTGVSWTNYINKEWKWTYTKSITLYAQWQVNKYTVTYNANGGTGTMATDTVEYGTNYITKANAFKKDGYVFTGWNENSNGTGTSWTNYIGKAWRWTYLRNVTLYAQYAPLVASTSNNLVYSSGTVYDESDWSESVYTNYSYSYTWNLNGTNKITGISFVNQTLNEVSPGMISGSWLISYKHYTATVTAYVDGVAITSASATPGSATNLNFGREVSGSTVKIVFSRNTQWHVGGQYYASHNDWLYAGDCGCYIKNLSLKTTN